MDARPIGMIDSGVGGLSVYRALRVLLPSENVLYFADTRYFPYGPRPAPEVRKRAFQGARRLIDGDAKLIIVACNTASAAALSDLRDAFSFMPFVGMVPGLKPAIGLSKARKVAVLATPGTFEGQLFEAVRAEFGRGTTVIPVPGGDLADIVEAGGANSEQAREVLRDVLGPAIEEAGADALVLGCTHYSFLVPAIEGLYPGVAIVDTSEPVARRAASLLDEAGTRNTTDAPGHLDIVVTGNRQAFLDTVGRLGI